MYAPPAAPIAVEAHAVDANTLRVPFDVDWHEPMRVRGRATRLRSGTMTLSPSGVDFEGKQGPSGATVAVALILGFAFGAGMGMLVAYGVVCGSIRSPATARYAWDQVEEVVIDRKAWRVAFVVKTDSGPESIVTKMRPDLAAHIADVLRGMFGETRVREGTMLPSLPKWAPFVAIGAIAVAFLVALAIVLALD